MAISLKHNFASGKSDGADATLVQPSNWNAEHDLTIATNRLVGRTTAGTGSVEEITVGTGLSLTAGTLAATGGSSSLTITNKTAAYTVVAGDAGAIINCTSGTFTVSLTAAATLGAGFNCSVWNTGTGVITVDPNSTETIDGVTTLVLRRGEGMQIVCDGTNWQTGNKKVMRGYAEGLASNATRPSAIGQGSVAIGRNAVAGDTDAVAIGANVSATGLAAVVLSGGGGTASGYGSVVLGGGEASGIASVVIGPLSLSAASAYNSYAIGGSCAANVIGKYAYGNLNSLTGAVGTAQNGVVILGAETTNATAKVLTSDGAVVASNNQINLSNNTAFAFDGIVVARRQASGGTASAAWKVEGLIRREASAGTTTLVASTVTAISNVPGWTLALSADTTNGALAVTATGAASTNIRWVATIRSSEVTYA